MKNLNVLLLLLLFTVSSKAQSVTGTWYGLLKLPGVNLNIVYHIEKNGELYTATMDSPDQGAKGLPVENTKFSNQELVLESPKFRMEFTGKFDPENDQITGNFKQATVTLPLVLSRTKPGSQEVEKAAVRPQDPTSFPYEREEVTFINSKAGNSLAGTLTMPSSGKVTKIVVLITGSGPQNRNEEMKQFNHRPFLVLSDWLTRQGIAVLRYDDRGVGKSTGIYTQATSADFADDAEAAVNYIKSRADLKNLAVGLVGHSEGGMIAPIVASRNTAVKFIVLLAGPGVPISELMIKQTTDQLKLAGASADAIASTSATNQKVYALMKQNAGLPAKEVNEKVSTLLLEEFSKYPADALGGANINDLVKKTVSGISSPWYHYFISFNPADYLTKVKCPVLAINGTLDSQVDCDQNLNAIKNSLTKGKNKNFQIVPLAGLNHLFQKAVTGSVQEYAEIQETINPVALEKTSTWINSL